MTTIESVSSGSESAVPASILEKYSKPADDPDQSRLDKDAFLKLLVAQMKYQDPLQPTSNEDFIATTAQFTTVEKLDELTKQGENTALVNALTTAGSLVGKEITTLRDGVDVSGVVQRSQISLGQVVLVTTNGEIPLADVTAISAPSAPSTNPPSQSPAEPLAPTVDNQKATQ